MNSEQFCYWLKGYLEFSEVNPDAELNASKTLNAIEDHLKLVFKKETPVYTNTPNLPEHLRRLSSTPYTGLPTLTC